MQLDENIARQLRARETPPLAPQNTWDETISQQLQSDDETLFGAEIVNACASSDAAAKIRRALCRAALLLWNDDLNAAHNIVQPHDDNATANFLHAVIHRRERDFSNALYWWRKTGAHPLLDNVGAAAKAVDGAREYSQLFGRDDVFNAAAFTQLCEKSSPQNDEVLRRIQSVELENIYEFCRAQLP